MFKDLLNLVTIELRVIQSKYIAGMEVWKNNNYLLL